MITWDDHIRFTPKTKKKFGRIKRRLRRHKLTSVLSYCIAFPTNPENKLDIYNMGELLFKRYEEYDDEIHIIGLAESRDAAIASMALLTYFMGSAIFPPSKIVWIWSKAAAAQP